MADSDRILSLMIQVGIVGEKDARALKDLLEETANVAGKDMATSLPAGAEAWQKYKGVLSETGHESEGFNLHGREMRKVLGELNGVIPGLGHAIEGVQKTIMGAGGGMVVLQLGIEAAKTYWELYAEAVQHAAEVQAASLDNMRTSLRSAREEMDGFKKAMADAMKPADPEAEKLANDRAILTAQFKGKRDLLKAAESDATAAANTPEEKEAVKKKFAAESANLDRQEEVQRQALLTRTIEGLTASQDADKLTQQKLINGIEANTLAMKEARQLNPNANVSDITKEIDSLTTQLKVVQDRMVENQGKITKYSGEAGTEGAVHGINEFTRTVVQNPTISRAVTGGGLDITPGVPLPDAQRQANAEMTKLFAQFQGGTQTMIAIIKHGHDVGATQQQQIEALTNALNTLAARTRNNSRQTAALAYHAAN